MLISNDDTKLRRFQVESMQQYIYGKNMVYEAIKTNKSLTIVYLLEGQKVNSLVNECRKRKIKVAYQNKDFFQATVGKVNHQGIIGLVEQYEYYDLAKIIDSIPEGKLPLLLMLDGLEDPHNLGAILRTSDATMVDGIIIPKNRSVSLNATVAKVSTGAIDHVKVVQVTNLGKTLSQLKKQGYWVVGLDNDESQDYRTIDYNMPLVVVMGSEGKGISRLVKQECDFKAVIPMRGAVTSLNVSVATAVILYQIFNSRYPIK